MRLPLFAENRYKEVTSARVRNLTGTVFEDALHCFCRCVETIRPREKHAQEASSTLQRDYYIVRVHRVELPTRSCIKVEIHAEHAVLSHDQPLPCDVALM